LPALLNVMVPVTFTEYTIVIGAGGSSYDFSMACEDGVGLNKGQQIGVDALGDHFCGLLESAFSKGLSPQKAALYRQISEKNLKDMKNLGTGTVKVDDIYRSGSKFESD
jgi:hypothetical protein